MAQGHKRPSQIHRQDLAGEYRWGDLGQILLLLIFLSGLVVDFFVLHYSESWQSLIAWYGRIMLFIPLFLVAIYFGQRSHTKVFGEQRKELMVIDTDVYASIRHPMYFGALMAYLSVIVLSLSLVALGIFIVAVMFYYFISRYEEKLLVDKLGSRYSDYIKRVPMLIPKLTLIKKN